MNTPNQSAIAQGAAADSAAVDAMPSGGSSTTGTDSGAATTAKLLTGLASRLRAAYEQGARLDDLAVASHQSVAEVRELLTLAGADPSSPQVPTGGGVVPPPRNGAAESLTTEAPEVGTADSWVSSAGRPRPRIRRQAPARRMRPAVAPTDQPPVQPAADPSPVAVADQTPAEPVRPEAPLGVLIGSPRPAVAPVVRSSVQQHRRVSASVIKVGQGTTLAVLPAWRSSIAISVPTELLLSATGLSLDELRQAELTVLVNVEALHDRELRPRDWQVAQQGRRS
jgi:hypothetical protein